MTLAVLALLALLAVGGIALDLWLVPVPKLGPFGTPCPACGRRPVAYHAGLGLVGVRSCDCGPEDYMRALREGADSARVG